MSLGLCFGETNVTEVNCGQPSTAIEYTPCSDLDDDFNLRINSHFLPSEMVLGPLF
jgi:hypothetical protein